MTAPILPTLPTLHLMDDFFEELGLGEMQPPLVATSAGSTPAAPVPPLPETQTASAAVPISVTAGTESPSSAKTSAPSAPRTPPLVTPKTPPLVTPKTPLPATPRTADTAVKARPTVVPSAKNGTGTAAAAAKKTPAATLSPKRGPGRPPSKQPPPPLEKHGIVDCPADSENKIEFAYSNPTIFKTLFTYFKNLKAELVHLRFSKRGITFFTQDLHKTSRIVAHIDCEQVNWYYCDVEECWLGINCKDVEKIFASIDKTFFKITITHPHDDPDSLLFIFKDPDIDKECIYKIALPKIEPNHTLYEAEKIIAPELLDKSFPLSFQLSAKQFKRSITDAVAFSKFLTIEKISKHPLQFTYMTNGTSYNEVYRSESKINLVSNIADGASFRCKIDISNIKTLSTSMVTESVRIYCRETDDILFRFSLDGKTLIVNTITTVAKNNAR